MIDAALQPFQFPFMQNAFWIALIVAPPCALLSCFLVLKGWALMGDAVSHAVLPGMLERGKGSLVMVASISGMVGMKTAHTYCAAKGGVINMVRAMANTYGSKGVRSNAVCPGYTDTPMIADVMNIFDDEHEANWLTPMARAGTPMEMAYGCLFMASDEASFVAAGNYMVDGGMAAL